MSPPSAAEPSGAGRWRDLPTRLISAAIMAAVGAVDIWFGGIWFLLLVVILTGLMLWELSNMTGPDDKAGSVGMGMIGALGLLGAIGLSYPMSVLFFLFPALAFLVSKRRDRLLAATASVVIVVAGFGLVQLRDAAGTLAIVWLIGVVIASDVLGYFAGRTIGGPKFWPAVSPKKTWSGTIAGWIGAALVGAGFVIAGKADLMIIPASVAVALAGQMGDIGESWIKRRAGVKDSSNLIPGHGGVMDRFDALTGAAAAVVALGLLISLPLPGGP